MFCRKQINFKTDFCIDFIMIDLSRAHWQLCEYVNGGQRLDMEYPTNTMAIEQQWTLEVSPNHTGETWVMMWIPALCIYASESVLLGPNVQHQFGLSLRWSAMLMDLVHHTRMPFLKQHTHSDIKTKFAFCHFKDTVYFVKYR